MINEKTSRKITHVTFGLCMAVIIIHTYNLEIYGLDTEAHSFTVYFEKLWWLLFNGTAVYYFALISGFLFFRNYDLSRVKEKYITRFHSILVPYLVWNTIYFIFFLVISNLSILNGIMNGDKLFFNLSSFALYLWNGYSTFWYLKVIIALIILSPFIFLVLKSREHYRPEITFVLMGVFIYFIAKESDASISRVLLLALYYMIGSYIGMNKPEIVNYRNERLSRFSFIILPMLMLLGYFISGNILFNAVLFVTLWLALDCFAFSKEPKWWLRCTFFYYCAHDLILESVEKVILIIGGRSEIMALIDFIIAPIITFGILVVGAWILKKYMAPLWKVLNGGR